ncbi:MAG: hypothetical protein EPN93_16475 [Spirochaetes bacterium]|nr:MAG: hypothetical protein EPN93_16475 [Spirochaetota bacterium]
MKRTLTAIISALVLHTQGASAADYTTAYRDCVINWTRGTIVSSALASVETDGRGQPVDANDGSPLSLNRARSDSAGRARGACVENVMAAIRTIRIDPRTLMKDLIASDDATQARLSEMLASGAKFRTFPRAHDGTVCELNLRVGDVAAALPYPFPQADFPVIDDTPLKSDYTGLIIDCRGTGMEPMIFPSVLNDEGVEIYGREFVDSAVATKYGLASYCTTEDEARAMKRAGSRPLFTIALKTVRGCPVISNRDARRILGSTATRNNLKKCRLIIILDTHQAAAR